MQKDFKIGLIVGLGLLIVAVLWLATRSSLAPEARLRRAVSSGVDSRDSNPYLAGTTVRAGGVSSGSAGSATNAHEKGFPPTAARQAISAKVQVQGRVRHCQQILI